MLRKVVTPDASKRRGHLLEPEVLGRARDAHAPRERRSREHDERVGHPQISGHSTKLSGRSPSPSRSGIGIRQISMGVTIPGIARKPERHRAELVAHFGLDLGGGEDLTGSGRVAQSGMRD